MNKKGFTLIELLAVIIILGILMIIAIPSVTQYINNSRKSAYIDTAKQIIAGARNLVNKGNLEMFDTGVTYYIPANAVSTENGLKSPYGDFTEAYVGVTYNGKSYNYYWISVDETGQGVKEITELSELNEDSIDSDLTDDMISDTIESTGIGNRKTIKVLDSNNSWNTVSEEATNFVEDEVSMKAIEYPNNKSRYTVSVGDLVKIGTEEFYIIANDNGKLTLLAKYNINVGNNKNPIVPEGRQDASLIGFNQETEQNHTVFAHVPYNNSGSYWQNKVGDGLQYPGNFCTSESSTNCANIFDSTPTIYRYVMDYKKYIESFGVPIKKARIITLEEAYYIRYRVNSVIICSNSSWISTPYNNGSMWSINLSYAQGPSKCGFASNFAYYNGYGVRPVLEL